MPDPRASDEAWTVTTPVRIELVHSGEVCSAVRDGDDALRAAWMPAGSYRMLEAAVSFVDPENQVFAAHVLPLTEFL